MTAQVDERKVRAAKKKIIVKKKSKHVLAATQKKPRTKMSKEKRALRDERDKQVLELRKGGVPFTDIAKALGYAHASGAKNAYDRAISRVEVFAAKDVVALDLARLEEFVMRCMHALRQNGDLGQIDRIMRVMEMRYRLLGVTEESVRALQETHGISSVTNNKNTVMVVQAAPETETDFIKKLMGAVGVDPNSKQAQKYIEEHSTAYGQPELPMAPGTANQLADEAKNAASTQIEGDDIVDAELVD